MAAEGGANGQRPQATVVVSEFGFGSIPLVLCITQGLFRCRFVAKQGSRPLEVEAAKFLVRKGFQNRGFVAWIVEPYQRPAPPDFLSGISIPLGNTSFGFAGDIAESPGMHRPDGVELVSERPLLNRCNHYRGRRLVLCNGLHRR